MWLPQTYKKEAESKGLVLKTIDAAVDQIDNVLSKTESLPSLLTLNHLATRVGVNVKELRQFVDRTNLSAYQRFSIRKRSGGRRFIAIPCPQLMRTQRWLNEYILKPLQRWSREFGPVVKVDRMTRETIQNDKEKEPFGGVQSQGCA